MMGECVHNVDVAHVSFETLQALEAKPYDAVCLRSNQTTNVSSGLATTLVQLLPTRHEQTTTATGQQQEEGEAYSDDCSMLLHLNPLLYEFLVRAQTMAGESSPQQQTDVDDTKAPTVSLTAFITYSSMEQDIPSVSRGWTVESVTPATNKKLNLTLMTICEGNSPSPHDKTTHDKAWISRALEGRIVLDKSSVIVLSSPQKGDALFWLTVTDEEEQSSSPSSPTFAGAFRLDINHGSAITLLESKASATVCDYENTETDANDTRVSCPGYEDLLEELETLFQLKDNASPSGILLTGCAGVGKTKLASCLAQSPYFKRDNVIVHCVSIHDLLLQASWATESDLLQLLLPPTIANNGRRTVVILDDLDVLGNPDDDTSPPAHDAEQMVTKNVVLTTMDRLIRRQGSQSRCIILGICQDVQCLPRELLCVGRLEKTVTMMPPTQWQRERILQELLFSQMNHGQGIGMVENSWVEALGRLTSGCVAADLVRLCANAFTNSWARRQQQKQGKDKDKNEPLVYTALVMPPISWTDLRQAAQSIVPSQLAQFDVIKTPALPDHLVNSSDYRQIHQWSWNKTFGGYVEVKKRLYRTVVAPWRHHVSSVGRQTGKVGGESMVGISPPSGVLFHGPSGTGKTLAASCLASSLGLPVVKVRASEVMDQWLGGSEAAVRSLFARARAAAPCILFFDELDAIASNRENDDGDDVSSRLLSTFLNEMDGISSGGHKGDVLVVAATNRLDDLDAALLRPGRLEEHIHFPLPSLIDIECILEIHMRAIPFGTTDKGIELKRVAQSLLELEASGADVEGFCRLLCLNATRKRDKAAEYSSEIVVSRVDVDNALQKWRKAKIGI